MTGDVLVLDGGGTARLLEARDDLVAVLASRAFPPGSPLGFRLPGVEAPYRAKVRACRRTDQEPERPFHVEARPVSFTREQRAALAGGVRRG